MATTTVRVPQSCEAIAIASHVTLCPEFDLPCGIGPWSGSGAITVPIIPAEPGYGGESGVLPQWPVVSELASGKCGNNLHPAAGTVRHRSTYHYGRHGMGNERYGWWLEGAARNPRIQREGVQRERMFRVAGIVLGDGDLQLRDLGDPEARHRATLSDPLSLTVMQGARP